MSGNRKKDWEEMKQEYEQRHMPEQKVELLKDTINRAKQDGRKKRRGRVVRGIASVAAVAVIFVALPNTSAQVAHAMSSIPVIGKLVDVVTFRNYQYNSERNNADVEVPELVVKEDETSKPQAQENLKKTTEEINAEIKQISDSFITEFEENMQNEEGYQNVTIKSEVIATTENYFTLKLICFQAAGSGAEWDYYYTIDLNTGERLALKDLFTEGADYITPVSDDIKRQMREQMAQDENVMYWLDDPEVPEWNFQAITDDTAFYVNADGNLVIFFNEGDVGPMSMGVVQFTIAPEAIQNIRK